jgi:hypothetical protein
MTPDHNEGRAAARRIQQANADGQLPDARDGLVMSVYHLSMLLRELPQRQRLAEAQKLARQLIANTRESLD